MRHVTRVFAALAACAAVSALGAACTQEDEASPAGGGGGASGGDADAASSRRGTVQRVSDGDTVRVRLDGDVVRVRLLGINAPEREREDHRGECWADEATRAAARLMPQGATVHVVADPSQDAVDQFGRLLGHVYVDGPGPVSGEGSVNLALVREGAARVYVYRRDPFAGAERFLAAQDDAREDGRGLWGSPCDGKR